MRAAARPDRAWSGAPFGDDRERAIGAPDPHTGRVDDRSRPDVEDLAGQDVLDVGAIDAPSGVYRAVCLDTSGHDRSQRLGRAGHGEREPRVVLHPVMEHE